MSKLKRFSIVLTTLALIGSTQNQLVGNAALVLGPADPKTAAVSGLGKCKTAQELDCVDTVTFIPSGGKIVAATYFSEEGLSERVDENGNKILNGSTSWKFTDQSTERSVRVTADLETPEHVILKNSNGDVSLRGAALRVTLNVNNPRETMLSIKIRTSWLRPMNVQLKAEDANFVWEKYGAGNILTLEGRGIGIADYSGNWLSIPEKKDFSAKADIEVENFLFIVHHADSDISKGYWPPLCADKGFTVQSHNTNATGDPQWNPLTESLEFSIFSPHLKSDGKANLGFFKIWAPDAFIDCKWPNNTITVAPKLKLEIIYEDGVVSVANTFVTRKSGRLYLEATGFHYSSPKIVLSAVALPIATPVQTPVKPKIVPKLKSSTITCVKGKSVAKITGISPKCPSGYSRKK